VQVSRTLTAIAQCAGHLRVTRFEDLDPGDCVIVSTKNSVYRLHSLGGKRFHVTGGWFDRNPSPSTMTVNGCTFGGRAICPDIVAEGLFLEFGNNVSTTRIQSVQVAKQAQLPNRFLN